MLKFSVNEVLAHAAEERKKPKPLPKIRFRKSSPEDAGPQVNITYDESQFTTAMEVNKAAILQVNEQAKAELVKKCWYEFNELKTERNQLSSMTWRMVEDGATTAQLKEHYAKIESYRPQLQQLFDRARHVDQYGALPIVQTNDSGQAVDIASLKYEKKKLSEKRSKLQKKIKLGETGNSSRLLEWQLELEQSTAMYNDLDERIRKMEGKA